MSEVTRLDLLVHLGDVTADGPSDPDEIAAARAALDRPRSTMPLYPAMPGK